MEITSPFPGLGEAPKCFAMMTLWHLNALQVASSYQLSEGKLSLSSGLIYKGKQPK